MSQSAADLACRRVVEIANDYLEGDMAPELRAQFEQHLLICDACDQYLRQSRLTIAALRALPVSPVTPDTRAALLQAFRQLKKPTGEP